MRAFFRSFAAYWSAPLPYLKRHLAASLILAALAFGLFFALVSVFGRLFESLWVEGVFQRITEKHFLLEPLAWLNQVAGNPLIDVFKPIVLYLAYSVALALLGLLAGPVNAWLSKHVEKESGMAAPCANPRSGLRDFFFSAKEELILLSWSIAWSAVLFALALVPDVGGTLSLAAFYIVTPLYYGLANLSYPLQRWGVSYSGIGEYGFRRAGAFYGFSWASAAGIFVVLLLLTKLPYDTATFALLFALIALLKPLGVVGGTLEALRYAVNKDMPRLTKTALTRFVEAIVFAVAVLTLYSWGQFFEQTSKKIDLIDCSYGISRFDVNFPKDLGGKSLLEKGLSIARFAAAPRVEVGLTVHNRSFKEIVVEDVELDILFDKKPVGRTSLRGFRVESGERAEALFELDLQAAKLAAGLVRELLDAKGARLQVRGRVYLAFWFGKVPYPVWLVR